MIHPAVYRLLTALLVLASSGCGDTRRSSAHAADTSAAEGRAAITTQSGDSTLSRASATDSARTDTIASPAAVVRHYYDAIERRQYDSAYALWGQSGKASGQTRAEFADGFTQTIQTTAAIGDSVSIEGAAGSQYATVPVTVDAVLRNGTRQHFVGTYTLRRAMVDGATAEQRRWHIYSAHLQQR